MSTARKNILKLAKDKIEKDLYAKWESLQSSFIQERDKDEPDPTALAKIAKEIEELASEINLWKTSKKKKKKASIEWKVDQDGVSLSNRQKPKRTVSDWDAVKKIQSNNRSNRPRAGAWLQEGTLVVRRGSDMPMMVLSITSNGIVEVLSGGSVRHFRDLSLRPAFETP